MNKHNNNSNSDNPFTSLRTDGVKMAQNVQKREICVTDAPEHKFKAFYVGI